jgi:anti-sigma regulatory factor (Ser/Thr protein kinase)
MTPPELTIRGEISELAKVNLWLEQQAVALALDPATVFALDLCLEEIITNTIKYGTVRGAARSATIGLSLETGSAGATLRVTDDAAPFNPLLAEEKALPETLEDAEIGGLGIHLIRRFASTITYSGAGGRNCLTLSFAPRQSND